jgi:enamine deaminase RidA (YjgF/YER057c/UK114 family)
MFVRTTCSSPDPGHWEGVARAHGEAFRHVRPAATCVVAQLLDPAWKVEIEAEAMVP